MVQFSLTVGKLDASLALLLTKDHHMIEFPTLLLPEGVEAGSIVTITCDKDLEQEAKERARFNAIQDDILQTFGTELPRTPKLRVRNVTQTSVVLEWDPIYIATADIIALTLFKNNQRFGIVPTPLKRTTTKLSGLAIDNVYEFHLELSTTAGTFKSDTIQVRTHKMTDLSGITVCVGSLVDSDVSLENIIKTVEKIGAKPVQDSVKLDTTHFVCTTNDGAQCKRAQDLNIPVVRPEWLKACESERRLVGVRAYYLNADPKLRPPTSRSRAESSATADSFSRESVARPEEPPKEPAPPKEESNKPLDEPISATSVPEVTVTEVANGSAEVAATEEKEKEILKEEADRASPSVAQQSYSASNLESEGTEIPETNVEESREPVHVSLTEPESNTESQPAETAQTNDSEGVQENDKEPKAFSPIAEETNIEASSPIAEETEKEAPSPIAEEKEIEASSPVAEETEIDASSPVAEKDVDTEAVKADFGAGDSSTAVDEPPPKAEAEDTVQKIDEEVPAKTESTKKNRNRRNKSKNKKSIENMQSISLD